MFVFIIKQMIREQKEKEERKSRPTKKEQIMTEFYNETKLSLHKIAKKYNAGYSYVRGLHSVFLRETK